MRLEVQFPILNQCDGLQVHAPDPTRCLWRLTDHLTTSLLFISPKDLFCSITGHAAEFGIVIPWYCGGPGPSKSMPSGQMLASRPDSDVMFLFTAQKIGSCSAILFTFALEPLIHGDLAASPFVFEVTLKEWQRWPCSCDGHPGRSGGWDHGYINAISVLYAQDIIKLIHHLQQRKANL